MGKLTYMDYLNSFTKSGSSFSAVIDNTLSIEGAAADAKAVGDKKVNQPLGINLQPTYGTNGQVLTTKGDGSTEWTDAGTLSEEQIAGAIEEYFEEHPEQSIIESDIFNQYTNKAIKQKLLAEENIGIDHTGNVEVFEKLITPNEVAPLNLYQYSNNQATPIVANYGCYKKYTVTPGETYYLTGRHYYTDIPFYILLDSSNNVVSYYDGGTTGHNVDNYELVIPSGAVTLIVNGQYFQYEKITVAQKPEIPQGNIYDNKVIALRSGSTTQYEFIDATYAKCVRFSINPSIGYCLIGGHHYYTDRPLYIVTNSSGTVLKYYDGGATGFDSDICCFGVPANSAYLYVNVSKDFVNTVKLYKYGTFDTLNGYVNTKIWKYIFQYQGRIVTPQMYGANPNTAGTSDCTAAIQKAIEAAKGGTVFFPKGIYAISSPIQTYKNNTNFTSLVFADDAKIVALQKIPYMLNLGVLGNDTRVGHVRKTLKGGIFDGSNGNITTAVVHISSGCMTLDMSDFQINANGCDGIHVGDSDSPSSIDANIHNGFIQHIGTDSSHSGIKLFGTDNNISDLRIYYFQKNIDVIVDTQFLNDIHTLSRNVSQGNVSLYIHDNAHVNCSNFYGDSEDTFVHLGSGSALTGNNLYYYSYRTNSVTVFDIYDNAKMFVYGMHLNVKDYNYIGFKLSSGELYKAISQGNFLITGMDIEGAEYLKNGDPLKCMMASNGQPLFNTTSLQANSWYHVCAYPADSSTKHWFKLFNGPESTLIPLNVKYADSALADTLLLSAVESNSTGVFDVGFALLNTSSGYALINVYIRASAAMDIDSFNVCSKYSVGGSTTNQKSDVSLSSASVNPTVIYRIDCANKTITKLT